MTLAVLAVLLACAILLVIRGPFWASSLGADFFAGFLPRHLMSDHQLKAPVSFDKADMALKAGDPLAALALYRGELNRHPGEPDVYLRMADAHRALKDGAMTASCLSEAARLASDPHRRGPILIQLAEQRLQDGEGAMSRRILEELLADPALKDYHEAARGRLAPRAPLKSPA